MAVSFIETLIWCGASAKNITESGILTMQNGNSTSCIRGLLAVLNTQNTVDINTKNK